MKYSIEDTSYIEGLLKDENVRNFDILKEIPKNFAMDYTNVASYIQSTYTLDVVREFLRDIILSEDEGQAIKSFEDLFLVDYRENPTLSYDNVKNIKEIYNILDGVRAINIDKEMVINVIADEILNVFSENDYFELAQVVLYYVNKNLKKKIKLHEEYKKTEVMYNV